MKQSKHTIKGFFTGFLTAVLVLGLALPAMAAIQEIRVSVGGIDIYVDGELKIPVNAQGTRVDPMVYDGTTYLPVRAISNMLGKEVTWDGETSSIYIGKAPSKGSVGVPAEKLEKFSGVHSIKTGKDAKYKILGDEYTPFNALYPGSKSAPDVHYYSTSDAITWKLDSEYASIDGKFIMAYSDLGDKTEFKVSFYNVDQYGEERLIKEFTNKCGDGVVDFHVNVTACDFVRVKGDWVVTGNGIPWLYDITATTAD